MAVFLDITAAADHIRQVDDQMYGSRRRLLALDTPLTVLLPPHLQDVSAPAAASYIAKRLLFTLTACAEQAVTRSDVALAGQWLSGCVNYLFTDCLPEERTFYSLLKLVRLRPVIRSRLFEDCLPIHHPLRRDQYIPRLLRELEPACVMVLMDAGRIKQQKP